jgi:5-methylcytosine-specific restriction endonuclease McrA
VNYAGISNAEVPAVPIRKENLHHYQGPEWEETRRRILKRAQNKCEFCGKPNGKLVYVTRDGTGRWNQALANAYRSTRVLVKRLLNEIPRSKKKEDLAFRTIWCWFGGDGQSLELAFPPGDNSLQTPESGYIYLIKVVLTIMHLNHTPGDDRDENLKAGCQRCHLNYDKEYHRMRRAERKDKERPLLQEIERLQAHQ